MSIGTLGSVVLDCPDPKELATFYAAVVGGDVEADDDDWVELRAADGVKVSFQRAPELRAPQWPDPERPQQFHIDVAVEDLDAAQEAVLALGAKLLEDDHGGERDWRVFSDPAGHPFCLCAC
ncbi:VOC family protein [Streptomyces sp. H10-C2]|uniref:VOC family protein n=1 Tax=unclassified Streptomyces TaxID=2593676 RepID=UPI0024BA2863|nr:MULTISPECIES: VOC family protein [unclassified Streptomyces]MDJ0341279.1 VOC family protein [Streptomyces sp. PH10-H1]MDJ0370874.1 VOC family protein [Streptomyces sp. H10-C2]